MTTQPKFYPLSLMTLAIFPLYGLAASPWVVTDGSVLQVTSGYSSTGQSDYPLYASGAGSQLITNGGLTFTSSVSTAARVNQGASLGLNDATLSVAGGSANGIEVINASAIINGSTIIMANGGSFSGNAIYGENADITVNDSALEVQGKTNTSVKLNGGTFTANNVTISGSLDSASGGDLYLTGSASATLDNVQITHPHENGGATININSGSVTGSNITINSSSLRYSAIIVGSGPYQPERSRLTLTGGTINNAFTGLLAMGGDMTLNDLDVTTRVNNAIAVNISMYSNTVIRGGNYSTSGTNAHGVWLAGYGHTTLDAADTTIATSGTGAYAVNAQFGTATLKNSTLTTSGANSRALNSAVETTGSGLTIATSGTAGHGVVACGNSVTESTITLTGSTISTTGTQALAVAGLADTALILSDITVTTSGNGSHAVQIASGKASLADSLLTTEGDKASILVTTGGDINIENSTFSTRGQYSYGIRASDAATVTADNLVVKTIGNTSDGIVIDDATLTFSNSEIKAGSDGGTNASGLLALNSLHNGSSVTLDNSSLSGSGDGVRVSGARLDLALNNGSSLYGSKGAAARTAIPEAGAAFASELNLTADDSNITGNLVADSGIFNVALNNNTLFDGATVNISQLSIDKTSSWHMNNSSSVNTLLLKGGTIAFSSESLPGTLTVRSGLSGSGTFIFNTVLGDDSSVTNKLVVMGNASGSYGIIVNNLDGTGAATVVGIPLIYVAGDAQSASFTQRNTIVVGNYQYMLNKVSEHDWYLQSSLTSVRLSDNAALFKSASQGTGEGADSPAAAAAIATATATSTATSTAITSYRPETAGFLITPWLNANYGFSTLSRWHERRDAYKSSTVWGKISAGHERHNAGRFAFDVNTAFVQFGGDLLQRGLADGWHLSAGPMVTLGHQRSSNKDMARGIRPELSVDVGKNSTRGYGAGGYLTAWRDGGAWLNAVAQATRYSNEFSSLTSGKTHAYGLVLSAGAGLPFKPGGGFTLEPQLQVTGQYLNVSKGNPGGVKLEAQAMLVGQLREGLRLSYDEAAVKPYLQADVVQWLGRTPGVVMNHETLKPDVRRSRWQAAAGVHGQLTPRLSASAQVSYAHSFGAGLEGYSGNLGLEYQF